MASRISSHLAIAHFPQYSLPSSPTCETLQQQPTPLRSDSHDLESICDPSLPPLGDWRLVPPSPDPRTGLLRLDLQHRLSNYQQWWTASATTAVGWHALKEENESIVSDTVRIYHLQYKPSWIEGREAVCDAYDTCRNTSKRTTRLRTLSRDKVATFGLRRTVGIDTRMDGLHRRNGRLCRSK